MKHKKTEGIPHFGWLALVAFALVAALDPACAVAGPTDAEVRRLKTEISTKGWLLFSATNSGGDSDLFLCRPDGSGKRNLTITPEWSEFGGRFSPDGKRILYRRLPKSPGAKEGEAINHDLWGATGTLVIANVDGTTPEVMGAENEWPWASWSPDGKQLACLYKREGVIRTFDLESRKMVKELPRQGIFQQLFWSRDANRLVGTANLNGQNWNIVSLDLESGKATQVSRNLCCTPDSFQGDATRVIYSSRIPGLGSDYGWTTLMQASADGKSRTLVYGERGRHIYYGCTSPDDKYAVFSVPESDGGTEAEMAVMRMADAPIIGGDEFPQLKAVYPGATAGPVAHLGLAGFEPHWTFTELPAK